MLQLSYNDKAVTLFEEGVEEPLRIVCEDAPGGYLDEFLQEIAHGGDAVTENVLTSTHQTLLIQAVANLEMGI